MAAIGLSLVCLIVAAAGESAPPPRSGSITWLRDGTTLAVANLDADSITLVGTDPFSKLAEIAVGRHPRSVAAGNDGKTLFVSLSETDQLVWVDLGRRRKTGELQVPGGPFAVVAHPKVEKLYVAAAYAHLISEVDTATAKITRQLQVAAAPRGLSLSPDGRRLYVVHFFTGELSVVDTTELRLVAKVSNRPDANLARSVAIAPDERAAYMPHLRSNVTNPRLQFDTTVFPVVSRLDLVERTALDAGRIALDAIGRPANNPWDAVVSADGRRLYVVNAGSDDVQVIDLKSGRSLAQIDVGNNPRGIVLSADGRRAYVHNALSSDVSMIDAGSLRELTRVKLTRDGPSDEIRRGKILFNSARSRSMALDRWISCASCHPNGESDGRTWHFAAGPRKTPSLHGAAVTMPYNHSPDRDEVQDTEGFIRCLMGGAGLIPGREPPAKLGPPSARRSEAADALAAYVLSLRPRPSPFAGGGIDRLAAIQRGREVFFSERTGCDRCHPPPYYTDSRLVHRPWRVHDVGTGDGAEERQGSAFDTPSLLGLYAANSYLHDGRARSLAEVFTTHNPEDRHGVTSHLGEDQVDDLVAFLLSLPAGTPDVAIREIDGPIDHNHCTTRQFQHMTFQHEGVWFVFYSDGKDFRYQTSDDGGATWRRAEEVVAPAPNGSSSFDVLKVDDAVYVSHTFYPLGRYDVNAPYAKDPARRGEYTHEGRIKRGRIDGCTIRWTEDVNPGFTPDYCNMLQDSDGYFWVVTREDQQGTAHRSRKPYDIGEWTPKSICLPVEGRHAIDAAALDDGKMLVVSLLTTNGTMYCNLFDGEDWGSDPVLVEEGLTTVAGDDRRLAIEFDPTRARLHLVYVDADNRLRYRHLDSPYRPVDWQPALSQPGLTLASRVFTCALSVGSSATPYGLVITYGTEKHVGEDKRQRTGELLCRRFDGLEWQGEPVLVRRPGTIHNWYPNVNQDAGEGLCVLYSRSLDEEHLGTPLAVMVSLCRP